MSAAEASDVNASDSQLAARARAGDRGAWAILAERSAPRLAAYLGARLRRPEVVERLVAEAVYAGWRSLAGLEDPNEFAAWFRRLGAKLALRWHQQHRNESLTGDFPLDRCRDDAERARMQALERALGRLEEGERMALEQCFRGGLTGGELAEALHTEDASAQAQVDAAVARLADLLAEEERRGAD